MITKSLEERERDRERYEGLERSLSAWGVRVVHKRHMHEKLVLIEGWILWQGSLNPLSFSATQKIMERRESREIVGDYARFSGLTIYLLPTAVTRRSVRIAAARSLRQRVAMSRSIGGAWSMRALAFDRRSDARRRSRHLPNVRR